MILEGLRILQFVIKYVTSLKVGKMLLLRENRNTVSLTFRLDQEKHIFTILAICNACENANMMIITLN